MINRVLFYILFLGFSSANIFCVNLDGPAIPPITPIRGTPREGEGREIVHHSSLPDILTAEEQTTFAERSTIFAQWKQLYTRQIYMMAAMAACYTLYQHPKINASIQKTTLMRYLTKRYDELEKKYGKEMLKIGGRIAYFITFGLYPFFRLHKLDTLASLVSTYITVKQYSNPPLPGHPPTIVIFKRKTFDHEERVGNTTTRYYNISRPLGWMAPEDIRTEFMPIRKAKSMRLLMWLSSTAHLLTACLC